VALDHNIVFFRLVPKRGGTTQIKSEAFEIASQLCRYYRRLNVESNLFCNVQWPFVSFFNLPEKAFSSKTVSL